MDKILKDVTKIKNGNKTELSKKLLLSILSEEIIQEQTPKKNKECNEVALHIMFYRPADDDFMINRAVAILSREKVFTDDGLNTYTHFAHVELSFPLSVTLEQFKDNQTMAFSITQTQNVFFRLKDWRVQYHKVSIFVTSEKYIKLYRICQEITSQNIHFDRYGMYFASVAPLYIIKTRTREEHGTFCSKIIIEVIQEAGILDDIFGNIHACQCTPSFIFKILQK